MIIDAQGNGSFLFQSLDPTDNSLYTYNANGIFVPVTTLVVGNGNGTITINANVLQASIAGSLGSNGQVLTSNGSALTYQKIVNALNGLSGNVTISTSDGTVISSSDGNIVMGGPGGFVNKFRNGPLDVWQRGVANSTITTAGAYYTDGWIVLPTGASVVAARAAGRLLTQHSLQLTGAAGVTALVARHRIESCISTPMTSQTVTVQLQAYNNTGAAITPTLSVGYPTVTDTYSAVGNASLTNIVNAANLQSCANGAWTQLSYTFAAGSSAINGMEVNVNFGAVVASEDVCVTEWDIRVTPGVSIGLNSNPPPPELRPIQTELEFCLRYLWVTPGTAQYWINAPASGNYWAQTLYFPVPMRVSPTASNVVFSATANIGTMAVNVLSDATYNFYGSSSASGQSYGTLNTGATFSAEL